MDLKEVIKSLSEMNGPSGYEAAVSKAAAELLRTYMDEVWTDALGNVIGKRSCGRPDAKKLLLDAHLDEISLVITKLEEGFLKFDIVSGGVDPRMLPGAEVQVMAGEGYYGVITCLPPHLISSADADKTMDVNELYIDVGLSQEEAKLNIPLGTMAVFKASLLPLGNDVICGKAFDDRACYVTLLMALDKLKGSELNVDLYVMGSVQEEAGLRGAGTGAFGVDPDYCVVVDVTHARTPDAKKDETFVFGGGAVIGYGPLVNKAMSKRLISIAKEKEIPYQLEVMGGSTGTNLGKIAISREGIPTALISLPLRYMHSPVETIKLSDCEAVAELLALYALSLEVN